MLADLLEPSSFVLDPTKRIYWGCLLSSLLLASAVTALRARRFDLRQQIKSLFNRAYWLNRSSLTDVCLMFVNNAVRVLVLVPLVGSQLIATLVVGRYLQGNVGDAPDIELPWLVIASLFSVTFFVVEDASRFFLHFAMHRVPALWRFHRTHHSAIVLTPLTLFRVHPVEHVLYYFRGLIVFGLVSGFFVWLFGRNLAALDILGVALFGFLFNLAGSNLRHSHVWLSFGSFERWFVSPAQHQLHHSRHHGHKNLGSALAIWDRLVGTDLRSGAVKELEFGVADDREQPAWIRVLAGNLGALRQRIQTVQ